MAKQSTKISVTEMDNEAIIEALNNRVQQNLDDVDQSMWANIFQAIGSVFGIVNIGSSWAKESIAYHKEVANISRAEDLHKELNKIRKRSKK